MKVPPSSYELWSDFPADPRCYYDDGWWCPCSRREEAGALAVLGVCLAPWLLLVVWLLGRVGR